MQKMLVAALVAAFAPVASLVGQTTLVPILIDESPSERAARAGLLQTPAGALPMIPTSTIIGEPQRTPMFSLRYGYIGGTNDFSFNNGGISATFPALFGTTVSLTGGILSCNGCGTAGMAGIAADHRIQDWPLRPDSNATRIMLSVAANAGYGWGTNSALSEGDVAGGTLTLPLTFRACQRLPDALCFIPFLAPGLGVGWADHLDRLERVGPAGELQVVTESSNGTRFVLGGGIAVYQRGSNFSVNFGAQYIATQFRNFMAGVGVNYGGL